MLAKGPDNPRSSVAADVPLDPNAEYSDPNFGLCENAVTCWNFVATLPCFCTNCETLLTYERGVVLRHGKRVHPGTLGGGMHYVIPSVDKILKVDVRERIIDIPQQEVVTKEGLNLTIDGVVYYKVFDAARALLTVENIYRSIAVIAQTKLREIVALHTYEQLQNQRLTIAKRLKKILDDASDCWGVDVRRVELTDLRLPAKLQQAMNSELEAKRRAVGDLIKARSRRDLALVDAHGTKEATLVKCEGDANSMVIRAGATAQQKMIQAEAEFKAAEDLRSAAQTMSEAPLAIQLQYLSTLSKISAGPGSISMIPFDEEQTKA